MQHTLRHTVMNDRLHKALRRRMMRTPEHIQHIALFDNFPALHDGHLVTDLLNDSHFMGDDHDRNVVLFVNFLEQLQN
ncbi:hypothetical protein D3C81_1820300 [compost metagenome]